MSTHLLHVKTGNEIVPVTYQQYLIGDQTPYSTVTTYSHHMIYIGVSLPTGNFEVFKQNTINDRLTPVGSISWSNIGSRYVGSILVDDYYVYASSTNIGVIRIYNLEDLSFVGAYQYSSSAFQAYGKMQWYDNNNICVFFDKGFLLFNTKTREYTYKSQSTSYTSQDMCVGNKLVLSTLSSSTAQSVFAYRKSDDTFFTFARTSNDTAVVCYENGKFYFVNKTYVDIYDEDTETLSSSPILGIWSGLNITPRCVSVTNGCLFINFCNSDKVYIVDTNSDYQQYIIMKWTIPTWNAEKEYIPYAYDGIFYFPYITYMKLDFSGTYKYNIGFKYEQFSVIYDSDNAATFTYDNRYIKFTDSYMTMIDGVLKYDMTEYDTANHIKQVSINKNDYKIMKKFIITREEEEPDGD